MKYFGTNLNEPGHYIWDLSNNRFNKSGINFNSLPFNPEELTRGLPKGDVIYYQGGGYTVIGISGSCKDERRGTKSIFWVQELISKIEMIERIQKHELAKKIIDKMPFTVLW